MRLTKGKIGGGIALFLSCLFTGIIVISIGIGAEVPQLNLLAGPFACPNGTLSLEQHAYNPSPGTSVVTQTWYCVNRATGVRTKLSLGSISIPAGSIYGILLFVAVLALIPVYQRWPRAVTYTLVVLFVGGLTAWNLSAVFGALFNTSSSPSPVIPVAQATATATPVDFAHVALSFGGQGTAPGLFQDAHGVALDPAGTIYVVDWKTRGLQAFDSAGKYLRGWTIDASLCPGQAVFWGNLRADRDGNLYIRFCDSILKYAGASGHLLAQFKGAPASPRDAYVDEVPYPGGGLLVVAQGTLPDHEVLLRLDPAGKVLARYPNLVTAQSNSSSVTLEPAVDPSGNIFLLNFWDGTVYKFTSDGRYNGQFGTAPTAGGQSDYRGVQIALDNQDRVYVASLSGIQVFDSAGTLLESMSSRSLNASIYDMQINDRNEIVLVASNNRIYTLARNTN